MKVSWLLPPERAASAPSGGDLYDAEIIDGLRRLGHRVEVHDTLPAVGDLRADVVVQDELGFRAFLPFNRALARHASAAARVALVHVTSARLGARTAAMEKQYLASTHAAVFVSHQARRESRRLLGRSSRSLRTHVVSPGADRLQPARAARRARRELVLINVAHLHPNKGQLELLEAFAESRLDATLVLVGSGEVDRAYKRSVLAKLRATPRARWLGPLDARALSRALSEADVFINSSAYESWGMAAAEARAAGLPVVSWSRGGLWEFLSPGVDSLRVRSPRAGLAKLRQKALVKQLQRGARAASVRHWSTAAAEFATFLERIASRPGRPR